MYAELEKEKSVVHQDVFHTPKQEDIVNGMIPMGKTIYCIRDDDE